MTVIVDNEGVTVCKPQRRRLSSYMNRHVVSDVSTQTNDSVSTQTNDSVPRWLKLLLNDDLHTGQNVGPKLAHLCPSNDKVSR